MDVFVEQIVKRKMLTTDKLLIALSALLAAVLSFFIFLISTNLGGWAPIGFIIGAGVIYFAWRIARSFSLEYEYILTNGEIDIDKITAQSSRRRCFSVRASKFEVFEKYDPQKIAGVSYKKRVIAGNLDETAYYVVFHHEVVGTVLFIFNPDERFLKALRPYLPRSLAGNLNV